jgi:hypothetical protein
VYLGYHPDMRRFLLLACALSCACASKIPDVASLCGTWSDGAGVTERWWIDAEGLRGEGQTTDEAGAVQSTEILELASSRLGHTYVARPNGAAPTEFAPLDPTDARFAVTAPAGADVWVWANYEHDFPQEIHYARVGDQLHAEIVGPGDGENHSMGWTLERTAACGQEPR